ncbi:hypothetical protein DXG03_009516 [Asterophora parasitica]|uniref:Uncharacterized protein n=1 Tax=Asterophora parasitica TaxID=117018 RepID=A0A9P7K9V8_9AGAR|nr:hypothetical protein DXG03_009516 [Asterophora parasitica]
MPKDNVELDSDEYQEPDDKKLKPRQTHRKRRKVQTGQHIFTTKSTLDPSTPRQIFDELGNGDSTVTSFQDIIDRILPDLLNERARLHDETAEIVRKGNNLSKVWRRSCIPPWSDGIYEKFTGYWSECFGKESTLLYNRFGFKAEEFVAGFYEEYLDPNSRASKNAFRLRLRQQ